MTLKRSEILNNRKIVVDFLKNPELRKIKDHLADTSGARCCLGHMCVALGLEGSVNQNTIDYSGETRLHNLLMFEHEEEILPGSIQEKLGMHDDVGSIIVVTQNDGEYIMHKEMLNFFTPDKDTISLRNFNKIDNLSDWNDKTNISPQELGKYLESVIEGGDSTPWKALTEYQEA